MQVLDSYVRISSPELKNGLEVSNSGGRAAHNWKEEMNQFAIYEDRFTRTVA